jgi:hypothetical protein
MRRLGYCRKKRQSELERCRKLERRKFYNRKLAPCDGDSIERIGWHAGYFLRQNEVDGKGEPGCLAMWNLHDAEPSHLDLAPKGRRCRGDKAPIILPLDPYLIIGDEKRLEPRFRAEREKTEREVGFAAAGGSADERRVRPERHAGAMDELAGLTHACLLDEPLRRRQPDHETGAAA